MIKIGIVGFGFVGQALYYSLIDKKNCIIYDPPKGFKDFVALKTCDTIFCALPSPVSQVDGQDFSYYKRLFNQLIEIDYKGIVVIKSTVLWSNVKEYTTKYNIVMNPEFLNQNSANEDFRNQKFIILGGRIDLTAQVEDIYRKGFYLPAPNLEFFHCSEQEAIQIKYVHNVYHAYKVLFWNYVHESCGNHRKISKAYSKITGNTFEMQNICADGKPGYGGACFPKDVKAADFENPHELTKFMIEYNKKLRGED